MNSLHRIWITSALSLLALTACSNSTPPTANNASPTAGNSSPVETEASPAAMADPKATFTSMKTVVFKTNAAVNAGDFTKAQEEFKDFDEGYWSKVEDGVKDKSADTYKQVENDMDNVTNGLKASQPNKTKLSADLQSLSKTIDSYTSTL